MNPRLKRSIRCFGRGFYRKNRDSGDPLFKLRKNEKNLKLGVDNTGNEWYYLPCC